MKTLIRWGKFNLVGAIGMGVQLGALALFNCLQPGHYLLASAVAIEIALVHNFLWHVNYTWRDRRENAGRVRQFIRFHLTNGLVSVVGNLGLMWLLVHGARLPLLLSNMAAILTCSIVNFYLGHRWAFAAAEDEPVPARLPKSRSSAFALLALALPLWWSR